MLYNIHRMKIKMILILMVVMAIAAGTIISRPIKSTYLSNGDLQALQISFKPLERICISCLIQITFPQPIHTASPLKYSIYTDNGLTLIDNALTLTPTSPSYLFSLLQPLGPNCWYLLKIYVDQRPTLNYGLIGFSVISGLSSNNIVYYKTQAFEYYHIEESSLPGQNLILGREGNRNQRASQIYEVIINFKSTYSLSRKIILSFMFTSQNFSTLTLATPIQQNNHFKFYGGCNFLCINITSCINQQHCFIKNNKISIELPSLDTQQYQFVFTVQNPSFVSQTGLIAIIQTQHAHIHGFGFLDSAFAVSPINLFSGGVNLFWGIPYSIADTEMNLGLFVDGGWNIIDIGWSVGETTMISSQFSVNIYVGASNVLQHSINTNLPEFGGSKNIKCKYALPNIICTPVDAFTRKNYRYFVKFKAKILSSDNIINLGSISIQNFPTQTYLFTNLIQNLNIRTIPYADYHDYLGFHKKSHNIQETQVIGAIDTGLPSSTSSLMTKLLNQGSSMIGIDPSVKDQQLIFLLKTEANQMSNDSIINKTYQMRVYLNPNIYQSIDERGLDFSALSSGGKYDMEGVSCYVNSFTTPTNQIHQCQAYNDHVHQLQIDNSFHSREYYAYYQFICGNGNIVKCPSDQNCSQSCRILKGHSSLVSHSAVFSIRNITFKAGYQSPIKANQLSFDFIVAFYHGGNLISASIINAYTINNHRSAFLNYKFYNYFLSINKTNDGSRVPTLLQIGGHLTLPQMKQRIYDEVVIFIPDQLSVNKYIQDDSRLGCSTQCYSYMLQASSCKDNWLCKQMISVRSITALTNNFKIIFPVQIKGQVVNSLQIGLAYQNNIFQVFRINGSSIQQSITALPAPTVAAISYLNDWVNNDYWVFNSTDSYNQGINLNQISSFSSQNSINMLGSTVTFTDHAFMIFTSINTAILTTYSMAYSNLQYRCDPIFRYTYRSTYPLMVLLCPLLENQPNQIEIFYPFYPNNLGRGFPFQKVFSYSICDSSGKMIAFRTQTNTKATQDLCITTHLNVYNFKEVTKGQMNFNIITAPITLSGNQYPSLQLRFTIPNVIPTVFFSCTANQTLINKNLLCSVIQSNAATVTIQISSTSTSQITISSFQIRLLVQPIGLANVDSSKVYYYGVEAILPQTDVMGLPSYFGISYHPYASIYQQCNNSMSLASIKGTNQTAELSNLDVECLSLNYYCQITFEVKFSISRNTILQTSQIVIKFTNATTSNKASCSSWNPQLNIFQTETILPNTISMKSKFSYSPFSSYSYLITCKHMMIQENFLSVQVQWIDGVNILQSSNVLSSNRAYLRPVSSNGAIVGKRLNSFGYDSEYEIQINLGTLKGDLINLWLDFDKHFIHSVVLECYDLSAPFPNQIYCSHALQKVHISFIAKESSKISISIYGVKPYLSTSTIQILTIINNTQYFVIQIIDALPPSIINNEPIIINNQITYQNYCHSIYLTFSIAPSGSFYIQLDDSLLVLLQDSLTCEMDKVNVSCIRQYSNLILFTFSSPLLPNNIYNFTICTIYPKSFDFYDHELIQIRAFIADGSEVTVGSHDHLEITQLYSNLPAPTVVLMQWQYPLTSQLSIYHIIYIGYYKNSISLTPSNLQPFNETIHSMPSFVNVSNYTIIVSNYHMGSQKINIQMSALNYSSQNTVAYVSFNHTAKYYQQPFKLPIFVSDEKCTLQVQFPSYTLYTGGITLPIVVNLQKCRPALSHSLTYSINNPSIIIDQSLTNRFINQNYSNIYIFLRQIPINQALNGFYQLQIDMHGPHSLSFNFASNVTIRVMAPTILQIPQSTQPIINQINYTLVNLTVQCNQPSTIYWVVGLYPTSLGMNYEQIQGKLIASNQGMKKRVRQLYSWSQQMYGMDYQNSANKNKTILIDEMRGSNNYIFKYFCVNQLGYASGAKILYFSTPQSPYHINKITLTFKKQITILQTNSIACYIAQVMKIPYQTVITSSFSNCINRSIILSQNQTYYDLKTNDSQFSYFFYVDTVAITSQAIRYNLPLKLPAYQPYVKLIEHYGSFSMYYILIFSQPLINNYSPYVRGKLFKVVNNKIQCIIDVGVVNSYLILGYINQTFNQASMSLPTSHMIKEGKFASGTEFNRVFMKYGTNNITISLTGLKHQNYSLFYFLTVDNPGFKAKPTQIYYQNIQIFSTLVYDLYSKRITFFCFIIFYLFFY